MVPVESVQECFALTSDLLERDPYALEAMPVHLAAALELGKKNELFLKAHKCVVHLLYHLPLITAPLQDVKPTAQETKRHIIQNCYQGPCPRNYLQCK